MKSDTLTQPLRVLKYVTDGFYDRSVVGLRLFEALETELNEMREWVQNVRDNAFPQTAHDWSVPFWEYAYGIVIEDKHVDDFEYRLKNVLLKIAAREPVNPAKLESWINDITGLDVEVVENVAPYTFFVRMFGHTSKLDEVYDLLNRVKPAHLKYVLNSILPTVGSSVYIGAAIGGYIRYSI